MGYEAIDVLLSRYLKYTCFKLLMTFFKKILYILYLFSLFFFFWIYIYLMKIYLKK